MEGSMAEYLNAGRILGWIAGALTFIAAYIYCTATYGFLLGLYRARFFGHKFELSDLLHAGALPGDTRLVRTS